MKVITLCQPYYLTQAHNTSKPLTLREFLEEKFEAYRKGIWNKAVTFTYNPNLYAIVLDFIDEDGRTGYTINTYQENLAAMKQYKVNRMLQKGFRAPQNEIAKYLTFTYPPSFDLPYNGTSKARLVMMKK